MTSNNEHDMQVLDIALLGDISAMTGEDDVFEELVTLFVGDSSSRIERLRAAAALADTPSMAKTAHALRGSAALVGAERMAGLAAKLEDAAKDNRCDEAVALLARLVEEFAAAAAALHQFTASRRES